MRFTRRTIGSRIGAGILLTFLPCAAVLACRDSAPPSAPTGVSTVPDPPVPPATVPTVPTTPTTGADSAFLAGRFAFEIESYSTPSGGSLPRIYTIRANGSGFLALTPEGEIGRAPAWSPDGTRLAYESWHVDASEIWTVRPDGTDRTLVAREAAAPFWLDDTHLGFQCGTSLCAIRDDGAERRVLLARNPVPNAEDFAYRLSPDGKAIIFTRISYLERPASSYVYVMNADGTGERRLTPDEQGDSPQWSPTGRRILFVGDKHGTAVADADGGPVTSVFPVPSTATWSPTGTEVVYARGNTFYFAPVGGTGPTHGLSLPISVYAMNAIAWTR